MRAADEVGWEAAVEVVLEEAVTVAIGKILLDGMADKEGSRLLYSMNRLIPR